MKHKDHGFQQESPEPVIHFQIPGCTTNSEVKAPKMRTTITQQLAVFTTSPLWAIQISSQNFAGLCIALPATLIEANLSPNFDLAESSSVNGTMTHGSLHQAKHPTWQVLGKESRLKLAPFMSPVFHTVAHRAQCAWGERLVPCQLFRTSNLLLKQYNAFSVKQCIQLAYD